MSDLRESFPVGSRPQLDVKLPSGDVQVLESAGATIEIELGGDVDRMIVERIGDVVRVAPRPGRLRRFGGFDRVARVPAGPYFYGRLGSADVTADVELAEIDLKSASGDIRLRDVSGDVTISAGSADISIRRVGGRLRIATASGDVRIGSVGNEADISAAAGDVFIERCEGDVSVKSASGDVSLECCVGGDVACRSMSGDVTVGIPAGRVIDLDLQTLSGDLRTDFEGASRAEPAGVTSQVRVKTVSGDITVERT